MKLGKLEEHTYKMEALKSLTIPQMMEVGVAEQDAVFIRSLLMEVPEKLRYRMDALEVELKKGTDDNLHVTSLHPVDEVQVGYILDAVRYQGREDLPEIRGMMQQVSPGKAYILDQQGTEVLKQHFPFHCGLAEEYKPPLEAADVSLLRNLSKKFAVGQAREMIDFKLRPSLEEEGKYRIDAIEIHAPLSQSMPKKLEQFIAQHQPPEVQEGELRYHCFRGNDLEDLRRDLSTEAKRGHGLD